MNAASGACPSSAVAPHPAAAAATLVGVASCTATVAAAQSEPGKCELIRIAEWPVRLVGNAILVDGAINGHHVAVAIDTGATMTIVLRATAHRLGLKLSEV